MFRDRDQEMNNDKKLVFDGDTKRFITWLSDIDQASVSIKGIEKHMSTIRTGHLPPYFVGNLGLLDSNTALCIPAAMASAWSEPFYGSAVPIRCVTVEQFMSYQEKLTTNKAAGSDDARVDSFHTGESVQFTLDRDRTPEDQVWMSGMLMGLSVAKGVAQATVVTPDGVEWIVPTDKGDIRKPTISDATDEATTSDKRSRKAFPTPTKDKRRTTKPRLGELAER